MSTDLYYRPVPVPKEDTLLPRALKYALSKRYWDHDGTINGTPIILADQDEAYLQGLRDAGVEGAQELIDAMKEHHLVEIYLQG